MSTQLQPKSETIQEFDFNLNLLQAILWEYTTASNIQSLLNAKQDWYNVNQTQFWQDWLVNVFNLETANDFGLSVWSIILNQPTYINNQPSPITYPGFGFGSNNKNFGNGNFASTTGNTYQLPTEIARIVLQLRYFQITSAGTVPEINRMLKYIFGNNYGSAWINDGLDMKQSYTFNFQIPAALLLAFDNFDILPRPAGVESRIVQGGILNFGFSANNANFNNGGFGKI